MADVTVQTKAQSPAGASTSMTFKQLSGFIAGPGGFLLLVFFFLPWISVSCSGNTLIEAKRFNEARALLRTINHPTASKWLAKIDELDPFPDPFDE